MELYLTVMNRLACHLGLVLLDDEKSMSHWNVDIMRGLAYPPQLVPTNDPIVEWMPRTGIAAPGHVCIRLQGFAETYEKEESLRRKKRLPVTLVFDACFRNSK